MKQWRVLLYTNTHIYCMNMVVNVLPGRYLGQCKARLKFLRVCLFLFFIFLFVSVLQHSNSQSVQNQSGLLACIFGPPQVHGVGALAPMNKFVCKLHGYVVYFHVAFNRLSSISHVKKVNKTFLMWKNRLCQNQDYHDWSEADTADSSIRPQPWQHLGPV